MFGRLLQGILGSFHLLDGHGIEKFFMQGQQHCDLPGNGYRCELGLLEAGTDAFAVLDRVARVFIQPGPEAGEVFQFFELGVGELEVAGNRTIDSALRLAANARNRAPDINRR